MEAASTSSSAPQLEPNIEAIKHRLLKHNITPTPKIIRALRKKQIQKHNRKLAKVTQTQLTTSQRQAVAEESHFQTLKREYRTFNKAIKCETGSSGMLVGRPWEKIERVRLRELARGSSEFNGENLKIETLRELKEIFEDGLKWALDDDIEIEDNGDLLSSENQLPYDSIKRRRKRNDKEEIRFLVDRLSKRDVSVKDWKLAKIMKQSGLRFNEGQLMKILEELGNKGKWEQAMAVVEWVYNDKERRDCKSRFVYTKLLSVLRIGRRPKEALRVFNLMRADRHIYPDMAAYHVIAVTLGQAGSLKELLKVVECMRQKPFKRHDKVCYKHWDPVLEPDIVVYNAMLNACVPNRQWKGVSWVFQQLRKSGIKPNGATYGLAMEVMLNSGKYDLVHELFKKMNRSGEPPKALTYKVLVSAFWEEGKVNEAVEAVREMEQRGVVGTGSVYYELACCLCYHGRWRDAMLEIRKMKNLHHTKPLEVTFTGLIMSSLDGGHITDCISIFEYMKSYCIPNIGTINTMLKVYGPNDLFSEAKMLFEEIKGGNGSGTCLVPDEFTYSSMLEASAHALQWEYFEFVYKEMILSGYQIDQTKHASLLVEASRAGKCHLLEHAFDASLEAGEIPHELLFTEMVFQATAQQNYERAVILVNTLALALFQISERQWINLFQKNGDKITQDGLDKFLDALRNSDIASEPTSANLSRALHYLCGRGISESFSNSCGLDITDIREDPLINITYNTDEGSDDLSDDFRNISRKDTDEVASRQNYRDGTGSIYTDLKAFAEDEAYDESMDSSDRNVKDSDEMDCEVRANEVDDCCGVKVPSAYEILDAWKERRKGEWFYPFQHGRKEEPTCASENVNV